MNVKIGAVLPGREPAYDIHFDDAPTFYVNGDATHPNGPGRTDPLVRQLERDVSNAVAPDPYAGGNTPIAEQLVDTVGEKTLHMTNADPKRTPTFTMFGNPDFFFQTTNLSVGCAGSTVCVNPGFAWNHGDIQDEIANTWVGFAVRAWTAASDNQTWTDHTNVRPTILALLGLQDDYVQDGRVLVETLEKSAVPAGLAQHDGTVKDLGKTYEQLNAPFGSFSLDVVAASTVALASMVRRDLQLDREPDREPDRAAGRARGLHPGRPQRGRLRWAGARREPGPRLERAGQEADPGGEEARPGQSEEEVADAYRARPQSGRAPDCLTRRRRGRRRRRRRRPRARRRGVRTPPPRAAGRAPG